MAVNQNYKRLIRRFIIMSFSIISVLVAFFLIDKNYISAENIDINIKGNAAMSATDALGRTLSDISGYSQNKFVGLFYFLWLGQQNQKEIYDITKILHKSSMEELLDTKSDKYPHTDTYFFNEPLYGYYNSADPYVIRKHIELFIAADIDFIVFDTTNAILYNNVWSEILDILDEYRLAGWKVPQIAFFTNTDSGNTVKQLYTYFYSKGIHKDLWFYGPYDKPLIIAKEEELTDTIKSFFYVRSPQWPLEEKKENGFPYMDLSKPQNIYTDIMNVSVCQFSGPCSYGVTVPAGSDRGYYGRGYSKETPENGNVRNILEGRNFQEQWDYAIKTDPEMVFITGWNEWIAQKSAEGYGWIDTFTTEWSRDIEMTKIENFASDDVKDYSAQGYGDNYYLQMVENIRRYKGKPVTGNIFAPPCMKTIDVNENPSQWDSIEGSANVFYNIAVQNTERDFAGASADIRYTQKAADNFIKEIKVTHDGENVYFFLKTEYDIQNRKNNAENWMNLLFSVKTDGKSTEQSQNWESFEYIVNRMPKSRTVTSLERVYKGNGGKQEFEEIQDVSYSVSQNVMQLQIPLKSIGISGKSFRIEFKASDSVENISDIMDYYVSGCSVPLGRMKYVYANYTDEISENKSGLSALEKTLLAVSLCTVAVSIGGFTVNQYIRRKKK